MLNIKQEESPYHSSRGNWKITGVVIHTTVGNYEGTLNWFKKNPGRVSAHYVIREDGGEITQMVDEGRAAHHAGITKDPSTPVYRGSNPNFYTIGIENADGGNPHSHIRDGQYKILGELVNDICKRNNISIDRDHICGHKELRSSKTCPGNIDVDKVVESALQKEEDESMPEWFETLLREWNTTIKDEGKIREIFGKAKDYDDKVKGLTEQVKSANEALADKSIEVSMLTDKVTALDSKVMEFEEQLNTARSERDKASWEADKLQVKVKTLEEDVERLQEDTEGYKTKIEGLKSDLAACKAKGVEGMSRWEIFKLLFKKRG
jgi:N-acetylmuramoyl-L-alanine amidase CwlA